MDFGETLVAMTAILLGCTIVILPIAALTARYALKPVLETWVQLREGPVAQERIEMMERRVALLEKQVEILERDNSRLLEAADFHARLRGPV
jgi:hypothetical protein